MCVKRERGLNEAIRERFVYVMKTPLAVCVYYCRTYYKAVCGGGWGTVKDMCYEVRRAEACVD